MSAAFSVNTEIGLIEPARQCLSPNHDERPADIEPELLVVHGISLPPGKFGGPEVEQLFTNSLDWDAHPYFSEIRGLKVSSHLLIRRDGELVQFVPFTHRAWHAGESFFRGRSCCNDFSLGIELEGVDDTPYTDEQYTVLVRRNECAAGMLSPSYCPQNCRPLRHLCGPKDGSRSCFRLASIV